MKDVFAFLEDVQYMFTLDGGIKLIGKVAQTFDNGIEVHGMVSTATELKVQAYRVPQNKILFWNEM